MRRPSLRGVLFVVALLVVLAVGVVLGQQRSDSVAQNPASSSAPSTPGAITPSTTDVSLDTQRLGENPDNAGQETATPSQSPSTNSAAPSLPADLQDAATLLERVTQLAEAHYSIKPDEDETTRTQLFSSPPFQSYVPEKFVADLVAYPTDGSDFNMLRGNEPFVVASGEAQPEIDIRPVTFRATTLLGQMEVPVEVSDDQWNITVPMSVEILDKNGKVWLQFTTPSTMWWQHTDQGWILSALLL